MKFGDYYRNPLLRLRLALLLGGFLLAGRTLGYIAIERMPFLDALFMTVITLSSVGYGEVKPLDTSGEIFTIGLIAVGLGTAAWLFTTVIETLVSEQTQLLLGRKRMDRLVNSLNNHTIVCGYGRIGTEIASGYTQNKVPYVVIENDPEQITLLREANIPHVEGDAADDAVLLRAGIHRAGALITVTPTDAINTFIVLSARGLQPDLFIIARADSMQNEAKLLRAGASKVFSPRIRRALDGSHGSQPGDDRLRERHDQCRPCGFCGARGGSHAAVRLRRAGFPGRTAQAENRRTGRRSAPGVRPARLSA